MLSQERRDGVDDLAIARIDRGLHGAPADVQVAARLGCCRYTEDCTDRLAIGEDDALVACRGFRKVLLRDRPPRRWLIDCGRGFEDRARVHVAVAHDEDAESAVAIDRLDNDGATLFAL